MSQSGIIAADAQPRQPTTLSINTRRREIMSLLAAYTFTCPNNSCSELLPPSFSSCPRCGFTLSHLIIPTSLEASAKRVKHTEVIRTGSVSIGNGPGGFNASFDHVGLASIGEIIQFTVAFGHRDYISSGPGRTLSQA